MGLDVGDKRIGVAFSDPSGILATPSKVLTRSDDNKDIAILADIVTHNDVGSIIVGLPYNMDGTLGEQAQKVRTFVDKLARQVKVPIIYRDERLTTVQAIQLMAETGKSRRRTTTHDAEAAAIILQSYLDEARPTNFNTTTG